MIKSGREKAWRKERPPTPVSMDCTVHGAAKSQMQWTDFHFHFSAFKVASWSLFQVMTLIQSLQEGKWLQSVF